MTPTRFGLILAATWFAVLLVLGLILRMDYQHVVGAAASVVIVLAISLYRREWRRNRPQTPRLRTIVTFEDEKQ